MTIFLGIIFGFKFLFYLAIWAQGLPSTARAAFEKCPRTLGLYASVLWEKQHLTEVLRSDTEQLDCTLTF